MNHKRICAPPMGTFKWGNGKSKVKLDKKKIIFSCLSIKGCHSHSLLHGKYSLKVAYRKEKLNVILQLQRKIVVSQRKCLQFSEILQFSKTFQFSKPYTNIAAKWSIMV